jgi:long-chain acyl-CoA synthetase
MNFLQMHTMNNRNLSLRLAVPVLTSEFSEHVCLETKERDQKISYTYAEFSRKVLKVARIFKNLGLTRGNRMMIVADTHPETIIVLQAIWELDCTAVIIDPDLSKEEMEKIIQQTEPKVVLVSEKYREQVLACNYQGVMIKIQNKLELCGIAQMVNREPSRLEDSEVAVILYTSGTTDHHHGVMLTHANILASVELSRAAVSLVSKDIVLTALPMFHIYPLVQSLITPLYTGVRNVIVNKMSPSALLLEMQEVKPTIVCLVPGLLHSLHQEISSKILNSTPALKMLKSSSVPQVLPSHLRRVIYKEAHQLMGGRVTRLICGGAKLNPRVITDFQNWGFQILEGYGLTEATGLVSLNSQHKPGTVGKVPSVISVQIRKSEDQDIGEILIKGPTVTKGYFADKETTDKFKQDGWFYTGDLGRIDKFGFLYVTGRTKEVIVTANGGKIFPEEIEQKYSGNALVEELAAFGVNHGERGEEVHLAVKLKPNAGKTVHELRLQVVQELKEKTSSLPFHLQIRNIHFVNDLPKTSSKKIKRHTLRALCLLNESELIY